MFEFETLIRCFVAYAKAHPNQLPDPDLGDDLDQSLAAAEAIQHWANTTPSWNTNAMQQQLHLEAAVLALASRPLRQQFFVAQRAALAQVQYGEHG